MLSTAPFPPIATAPVLGQFALRIASTNGWLDPLPVHERNTVHDLDKDVAEFALPYVPLDPFCRERKLNLGRVMEQQVLLQ
jgi:hypothetical protein